MATPAQRSTAKRLYQDMLRAAGEFKTYSFRDYFTRRAHDSFAQQVEAASATRETTENFLDQGMTEWARLRRQATVNSIFGTGNSIIDQLPAAVPAASSDSTSANKQ